MGVPAWPDTGYDALCSSVIERGAVGLGGTVCERPKHGVRPVFAVAFETGKRGFQELGCASVGKERGDGSHGISALAERRPIEAEVTQ